MRSKSVVVIGAGVGGIIAALHLARGGQHVTVLERTPDPAVAAATLAASVIILTPAPPSWSCPCCMKPNFKGLGTSLHEQLALLRVDPTYRLVFDDGCQLALTSDMQSLHTQLEAIQPGSFQGLLRYLQEGEQHYRLVLERLVNRNFRKASISSTFKIFP